MAKPTDIIERYDQRIRNLFFRKGFENDELTEILTEFKYEIIALDRHFEINIKKLSNPPKSKFMEEWGKVEVKPSEVFDGAGIWKSMKQLVILIEKYKEDK